MNKIGKIFFLISFFPAAAYWYLEANYSVKVAITGGIALAFIEMALEKLITKKVHTIAKFNLLVMLLLGVVSYWADKGIWFKLQPMITGVIIGGFLFYKANKGQGVMAEITMEFMDEDRRPPEEIINGMERDISVLLFVYGLFMGIVAVTMTTSQWLFFKTAGFYLAFIPFFIVEMFLIRRRMKSAYSQKGRQDVIQESGKRF